MQTTLFETPADYVAFERVLHEAVERMGMRVLAYCAMPNHWHPVEWLRQDGNLSNFMGWLTLTLTQRWHASQEKFSRKLSPRWPRSAAASTEERHSETLNGSARCNKWA